MKEYDEHYFAQFQNKTIKKIEYLEAGERYNEKPVNTDGLIIFFTDDTQLIIYTSEWISYFEMK